jgi:hypothetical protein
MRTTQVLYFPSHYKKEYLYKEYMSNNKLSSAEVLLFSDIDNVFSEQIAKASIDIDPLDDGRISLLVSLAGRLSVPNQILPTCSLIKVGLEAGAASTGVFVCIEDHTDGRYHRMPFVTAASGLMLYARDRPRASEQIVDGLRGYIADAAWDPGLSRSKGKALASVAVNALIRDVA